MKKGVIVHLSDIHYDGTEQSQKLLSNLRNDLEIMRTKIGNFDHLIITGDCINRGKVSLFNNFDQELKSILKVIGLRTNNVSIAIGNHDVDKNGKTIITLRQQNDSIDKLDNDVEDNLDLLFKDFDNVLGKYNRDNPSNENSCGIGLKCININGMTIWIVLINSSWSVLTHNEYGNLSIGDMQLEKIKHAINRKRKKPEIVIACLHHPLDWFKYEERTKLQKFLIETVKADFILHGHIHQASYDSIFDMDTSTNMFCTGISYKKTGENCSRKDGMRYSIYELDKDTRTVNVYLRSTNEKGIFVGDNRLYTKVNKDGFFSIPTGNIYECLLPVKSVEAEQNKSIFLSREFVELLLSKEQKLFKYYRGLEAAIEDYKSEKSFKKYAETWKKNNGIKSLKGTNKARCIHEYNKDNLSYYLYSILIDLNSLFFENHNDIRLILRKYDSKKNEHVVYSGEGANSSQAELDKVKSFKWGEGLIYQSYLKKTPLLKKFNLAYHAEGNTHDIWKEYLTVAIDGVTYNNSKELIPLFALNIATKSQEDECCLQALAQTSIYEKMQDALLLFERNICKISDLLEI